MIEGIFGNATAEKVMLYLERYGDAYGRAISETFDDVSISMAQGQLKRFERSGLLFSELKGRTRIFRWNPRYPFLFEVRALLRKALEALPAEDRERYFMKRLRPRRTGKAL